MNLRMIGTMFLLVYLVLFVSAYMIGLLGVGRRPGDGLDDRLSVGNGLPRRWGLRP